MDNLTCLGVGSILMDITVTTAEDILLKYNLSPNGAARATESQIPLFEEVMKLPETKLSPGGSCFNTATVLQSLSQNSVMFFGCLGDDFCGKKLCEFIKQTKIDAEIEIAKKGVPTGVCAVFVKKTDRSIISCVGAAEKLSQDFLSEKMEKIRKSDIIFTTGFELLDIFGVIELMVDYVAKSRKIFCYNIGAEYISVNKKSSKNQKIIFPSVDYCFGNLKECQAFIRSFDIDVESADQIATEIARLPKLNTFRQRTVVITDGADKITVFQDGKVYKFKPHVVLEPEFVNTNGAGDAFMGGFLYGLSCGGSLAECVERACVCAARIIRMSEGCII